MSADDANLTVKVEVERVGTAHARELWNGVDRTTVFTHPDVLEALGQKIEWWVALASGRPAWAWPVCLDARGRVAPPELAYYVGPFRIGSPDRSPRGRLMRDVAIHHALLETLSRTYGRLAWGTMPGEHELRPWLWYGNDARRVVATPRYTAVLDDLGSDGGESLPRRFSTLRRRDLRVALSRNPVLLPTAPAGRIKELYRETLAASGAANVAERRFGEIDALVELAGRGHGRVMTFGVGDDGIARAVWIILVGKGRACEVIAASDWEWKRARLNAHGRLQSILAVGAMGANCYDFNGANSPRRGADKHSYGAEAALYFDVSLDA